MRSSGRQEPATGSSDEGPEGRCDLNGVVGGGGLAWHVPDVAVLEEPRNQRRGLYGAVGPCSVDFRPNQRRPSGLSQRGRGRHRRCSRHRSRGRRDTARGRTARLWNQGWAAFDCRASGRHGHQAGRSPWFAKDHHWTWSHLREHWKRRRRQRRSHRQRRNRRRRSGGRGHCNGARRGCASGRRCQGRRRCSQRRQTPCPMNVGAWYWRSCILPGVEIDHTCAWSRGVGPAGQGDLRGHGHGVPGGSLVEHPIVHHPHVHHERGRCGRPWRHWPC